MVTGTSRGLGQYFGRALTRAGADLVITSREPLSLADFQREVEGLGRRALAGARIVAELEVNARAASEPLPPAAMKRLDRSTRPLLERLGASFDDYETAANDRMG